MIVLGFVAVFLLREWISQNARPGVFDDADAPAEGQVQPVQDQVVRPALEPDERGPMRADLIFAPIPEEPFPRVPRFLNGAAQLNERPATNGLLNGDQGVFNEDDHEDKSDVNQDDASDKDVSNGLPSESTQPSALQRRPHSWGDGYSSSAGGSSSLGISPEQAQFTFRTPSPRLVSSGGSDGRNSVVDNDHGYYADGMPSPSATMEEKIRWFDESVPPTGRRPALPNTTLSDSLTSSPATSAGRSRTHTPLGSPSLATYRAPEELDMRHSDLPPSYEESGGAPQPGEDPATLREEHNRYFREPLGKEVDDETEDEDATMMENNQDGLRLPQWSDEEFEEDEEDEGPFGEEPDEEERPEEEEEAEVPANRPRDQQQPAREEPELMDPEEEVNLEDDMDGALEGV